MGGPRACGAARDAAVRHGMLGFFSGDVRCVRYGYPRCAAVGPLALCGDDTGAILAAPPSGGVGKGVFVGAATHLGW